MHITDIYHLERSDQFTLGPRQEININLSLKKVQKEPCTILMGNVVGKCGEIEGATVRVLDKNHKPIAQTVTDHDGYFIFRNILPPGEYEVIATAEGYKVSEVQRVVIQSKKAVLIFIYLKVSDFNNLATAYGVVYNGVNLGLANTKIVITDYEKPDILKASTKTNSDGEFLVVGLKPNKYWISASKEGYFLPQKISFELAPNEISCVNLFLYPDEESANGIVSGVIDFYGHSIANTVAALYKVENSSHFLIATKETNKSGFYLFPNVKPGEYLVKSKTETDCKNNSCE